MVLISLPIGLTFLFNCALVYFLYLLFNSCNGPTISTIASISRVIYDGTKDFLVGMI